MDQMRDLRLFIAAEPTPPGDDTAAQAENPGLVEQMLGRAAEAGVGGKVEGLARRLGSSLVESSCRSWLLECQASIGSENRWLAGAASVADLHTLSAAISSGVRAAVDRVAPGRAWPDVWVGVLGSEAMGGDLWRVVFGPPFGSRAREIVREALRTPAPYADVPGL